MVDCAQLSVPGEGPSENNVLNIATCLLVGNSFSPASSFESLEESTDSNDTVECSALFGMTTVKVDNPQKHTTLMDTYITYRVSGQIEHNGSLQEFAVRRRFSDFLWMRHQLIEAFPSVIVPPLPEKHNLWEQLDRYSKDFVQSRLLMLRRFLHHVTHHPVLNRHNSLHKFLTSKSSNDFLDRSATKQNSLLGKMAESFQTLSVSSCLLRNETQEFDKVRDFVVQLGEKLTALEKVALNLLNVRNDSWECQRTCHSVLNNWASIDPDLCSSLQAMSLAAEKCARSEQALIQTHDRRWIQPLKEYQLYVAAVREVLARRDRIQLSYKISLEELHKKKEEKDEFDLCQRNSFAFGPSLWRSPEEIRERKRNGLEKSLKALSTCTEENYELMEKVNDDLRSDYKRWSNQKTTDLRKMLSGIAEEEMKYHRQCLETWEEAARTLKDNQTSSSFSNSTGLEQQ